MSKWYEYIYKIENKDGSRLFDGVGDGIYPRRAGIKSSKRGMVQGKGLAPSTHIYIIYKLISILHKTQKKKNKKL